MLRFRDEAYQRAFEREGYVILRLLDDDQLVRARNDLESAAAGRSFGRNDVEDSYFNSMFDREPGFQERYRAAMADIFAPKLNKLLSDAEIFETSLLYKPDESGELLLHQHVPLTEQPFAPAVFSWCPLVDCDEHSGALYVVPGSHLLLRYMRILETGEYFEDYRYELTRKHAVPIRLKAGEAILFENSLLHGSYPNRSDRPRPVVLSIVMHEGASHVVYKRDERGRVAVIDNDYTEIQCQTMMPGAPEQLPGQIVRRLPFWDEKPTLDELEELLARGRRASEDYDPLAELRAERRPGWQRMARALLPRIGASA